MDGKVVKAGRCLCLEVERDFNRLAVDLAADVLEPSVLQPKLAMLKTE